MKRLPRLRLIVDPRSSSGAWNMAVDEVLLQSAIDQGIATLRWYTWSEPTVSLGYFQRDEDLIADVRLARLPRVRRLSGGGTLVHDRELTYSLALPASQRVVDQPVELYRRVHRAFVEVLRSRGANVNLRGTVPRQPAPPVLCFARQDENDVVLQGRKVLGSAQRRRRGAILQHGGLLLKASSWTPELPGISDLCPQADLSELPQAVGMALQIEIAEAGLSEPLTPAEEERAAQLAEVSPISRHRMEASLANLDDVQ